MATRYCFKRTGEGIHLLNIGKTWEKIMVAARIIVAIENPKDIIVCSQRPYGSRAVLKFAQSAQLPQTTEYFFPQTTEHFFPTSDGALLP